ncbi:MAG: hypothetical protein ACRDFY_04975, partial [Candidatus Limnocylindria bacterium]
MPFSNPRPTPARLLLVGLVAAAVGPACEPRDGLPEPSTPEYEEAVRAFNRGLAAAQVGETGVADESFRRVIE